MDHRPPGLSRPRADQYSLGCVAYYLLTGREVFEGDTPMQVFAHHFQTAPTPPSQRGPHAVPADLEKLVMTCLAKKPEERPRSAAELDRRLAAVDVASWTDDDAKQWWMATATSAGDVNGNAETLPAPHASGRSITRPNVDIRDASGAPEHPDRR